MKSPFDDIAQPPKPTRSTKRPRKHPEKRDRTQPDCLEQKRSLAEILEEKCAGEDPADDAYWSGKEGDPQ